MPLSSQKKPSSAAKTTQMHHVNSESCELNKSSLLPQSIAYNITFKVFLRVHFGWIPGPTKDSGSFALRFSGMCCTFCVLLPVVRETNKLHSIKSRRSGNNQQVVLKKEMLPWDPFIPSWSLRESFLSVLKVIFWYFFVFLDGFTAFASNQLDQQEKKQTRKSH